jgi:homogentisate 1,2-dioxygenase
VTGQFSRGENCRKTRVFPRSSPSRTCQGFGNDFETEALPDALPQGMNSPQKCNYGLYGEQLSGTAFTAPSHQNERTWCYRIRPSVKHSPAVSEDRPALLEIGAARGPGRDLARPVPLGPGAAYRREADLADRHAHHDHGGRRQHAGRHGQPHLPGHRIDGGRLFLLRRFSELLVVPQEGRLRFFTELGIIDLEPKEIAIIPRGLVYRVELIDGPARGFVCENYGQKFELPGRGPIGANCMANRATSRRRSRPSRTARCRRPSP